MTDVSECDPPELLGVEPNVPDEVKKLVTDMIDPLVSYDPLPSLLTPLEQMELHLPGAKRLKTHFQLPGGVSKDVPDPGVLKGFESDVPEPELIDRVKLDASEFERIDEGKLVRPELLDSDETFPDETYSNETFADSYGILPYEFPFPFDSNYDSDDSDYVPYSEIENLMGKRPYFSSCKLINGNEFLNTHQDSVHITVSVPKHPEHDIEAQLLPIEVKSLTDKVSSLKKIIANRIGLPEGSILRLSTKVGSMENHSKLAHFNLQNGDRLFASFTIW